MSAKAILVAKLNSLQFEDRVLLLDVPAKVGRSHKDEQAESGNGFFDCKVLSRQHALLMYEDERFYLLDLGSSNGTFVNNIRLSKGGEESKMTELFTNDILRFGSDIVDKSRQVTQKCVVAKIQLFHTDGVEVIPRPAESRLFRPNDDFEDMQAITQSLQEALSREKNLEDKIIKVRGMISKNIGRSQTDLMRAFEDIKEELMNLYETAATTQNTTDSIDDKVTAENMMLTRKVHELEEKLSGQGTELSALQNQHEHTFSDTKMKQQTDELEIITLRKACEMQKADIETLNQENDDLENFRQGLIETHKEELQQQDDAFNEEKGTLKEKLHEVTSNEINLLNRIKSLESNESYSRAEVDRCLAKERDTMETQQRLQYRIECLETELDNANRVIEEQSSQVIIQRSEEDIDQIAQQEQIIAKLHEDVSYIKQELIAARSHKAASDDELGNVKGQLETLENNISSLSEEGIRLRKQISILEETCEARTQEANHMKTLVSQMEAAAGQDEQSKVQITDLKAELAKAEENLEVRTEETVQLKRDLRTKDEYIQQREIDISCLRGQIQNITDEMDSLKSQTSDVMAIKEENNILMQRLESIQFEADNMLKENERLCDDLDRQQTLYNELKKMRGRGEEMDMLQHMEKETRDYQYRIQELEAELDKMTANLENLTEEKIRLLRAIAQLKAGRGSSLQDISDISGVLLDHTEAEVSYVQQQSPHSISTIRPKSATEVAMASVGSLRVYEMMLGLCFITIILNWILMP